MVAVTAQSIRKAFGETKVLRGVDLDVPDGAFCVLVGPSGCGKSTLLRILAGLEQVDRGTIAFGGRDVTHLEPRDRSIAMVFQSYALYPHMTVRQNLEFGLRMHKVDAATRERRVQEAARMLDIEHLLDRQPRALSGGQRQRVAMGRAIVRRPDLFLFDEPLSNLDPELRNQVRVEMRKRHQELGTTSVYVTHDQVEAMTLADVLYVLNDGQVQQSGAPDAIYREPSNMFVAKFLGSPRMNFIRGRLAHGDGGWQVYPRGGRRGVRVRWPESKLSKLEDGQDVMVGVRPHELTVCDSEVADLRLDVDVVEMLGPEVLVHGRRPEASDPLAMSLTTSTIPRAGERVYARIGQMHLFDTDSQRSLRC